MHCISMPQDNNIWIENLWRSVVSVWEHPPWVFFPRRFNRLQINGAILHWIYLTQRIRRAQRDSLDLWRFVCGFSRKIFSHRFNRSHRLMVHTALDLSHTENTESQFRSASVSWFWRSVEITPHEILHRIFSTFSWRMCSWMDPFHAKIGRMWYFSLKHLEKCDEVTIFARKNVIWLWNCSDER